MKVKCMGSGKKKYRGGGEVVKELNQEQEIPPNIIRIETEDESDEFIEIVLPY